MEAPTHPARWAAGWRHPDRPRASSAQGFFGFHPGSKLAISAPWRASC